MNPTILTAVECILHLIVIYYLVQGYKLSKSYGFLVLIFAFLLNGIRSLFPLNTLLQTDDSRGFLFPTDYFYIGIAISILFLIGIRTLKSTLIDSYNNFAQSQKTFNTTEQKWKSFIEAIPDYIAIYDTNGKYLFLNRYAEGFSEKDIEGKYCYDFLPEDSKEKMKTTFRKAVETKEIQFFEHSGFGDNRSIRSYNNFIVPIIKDNSIENVLIISRDITEMKGIQKSILENESLLQMAYETTDMGIIRRDLNSDILIFNERAQAHCGVKLKEIPTMEVLEKIHPDDLIRLKQKMEETKNLENDGKYTIEYRILHEGVGYRWVAIEAQYVFEGEGKERHAVATLSTTRDVTSRKNLEQEILEKNKLLEMAYDATEMGVWKHDIATNIFYFNERSQMHHGFDKSEVTFEVLASILHPDDVSELQKAFLRAIGMEGNGKYSQQFRIFHKDKGLRWLSIDAFIATDGEGENKHPIFAVGTSRDITDQKNAELELEKYRNQLEELVEERTKQLSESLEQIQTINLNLTQKDIEISSVNKELEAFSYSVSHDLRAPLRSIDGFSNLIVKKYFDLLPEEGQDYFQRIRNASQKMAALIDDLLKLSRINRTEIHKENINISEIAVSIANDLITLEPDRKGDFIIHPDIIVFADKNLIRIALQNLLANAWKYTRNKQESKIEFGSFIQEQTQVCFIKDNGAGFDMKYVDKLFGAFQRLHSSSEFEGTGVGLATTQRIINRHGGKIWTEAEVDKGATFYFTV